MIYKDISSVNFTENQEANLLIENDGELVRKKNGELSNDGTSSGITIVVEVDGNNFIVCNANDLPTYEEVSEMFENQNIPVITGLYTERDDGVDICGSPVNVLSLDIPSNFFLVTSLCQMGFHEGGGSSGPGPASEITPLTTGAPSEPDNDAWVFYFWAFDQYGTLDYYVFCDSVDGWYVMWNYSGDE